MSRKLKLIRGRYEVKNAERERMGRQKIRHCLWNKIGTCGLSRILDNEKES